ncbi:MAG TPA: GAF domain-containing sensor histidine kinase [Gemmatimonadaceae bacterium]|nr:GAF domain-containing sensor histidine kinase [Gemmatimonadaceae bacterium]
MTAPSPQPTPEEAARVADVLVRTGLALASTSKLDELLQILADAARDLVGARYGALGVVNAEGTGLSDFITSGLTPAQRAKMGALPTGHGILGLLVRDARPLRLHDLREHPASVGVPRNHPQMRSFLGTPIVAQGRVFGNLYVTEKQGGGDFGENDLDLLRVLAAQAAIAIENAYLRLARDRFFAATSHELGNAIAAVKVWARHLMQAPPEDPAQLHTGLRNLAGSAEQTSRLIEDLLSLSRIQEGRLTLGAWDLDVGETVAAAVEHLRLESEVAGVHLVLQPPGGELRAELDGGRVRQIVINLVANAIKFTPEGRTVTVAVGSRAGAGVRVSVTDSGPGISAENQERIFLPYEQIVGVAKGRGTGLGLGLSRQLARLMGGEITVVSTPGQGATFHLDLPLVMAERADAR